LQLASPYVFGPPKIRDLEIAVLRTAVVHEGRTFAGDVQVTGAGSGTTHSEDNAEPDPTKIFPNLASSTQMPVVSCAQEIGHF
jgi:hypothetical protein